ncbi:gp62 [Brochothrix phage BL3]|nr:gp62 [Brochothrix phage BL3]ADH03143.1 gp62 [Brochothrix phage BL3]
MQSFVGIDLKQQLSAIVVEQVDTKLLLMHKHGDYPIRVVR